MADDLGDMARSRLIMYVLHTQGLKFDFANDDFVLRIISTQVFLIVKREIRESHSQGYPYVVVIQAWSLGKIYLSKFSSFL